MNPFNENKEINYFCELLLLKTTNFRFNIDFFNDRVQKDKEFFYGLLIFSLFVFSLVLNNYPRKLKQSLYLILFSLTNFLFLYFKPPTINSYYYNLMILVYPVIALQIFRLRKTKYYAYFKEIRIVGGPYYGCLIFMKTLISFYFTHLYSETCMYLNLLSLVVFIIGVYFRPSAEEVDSSVQLDLNRKTHGKLMMISSFICLVSDIIKLIN